MEASKIKGSAWFLNVLPERGRETQLLYWFRVCVAEWSNGIDPRRGVKAEELLIWDKGRQAYVLETHRYGVGVNHSCERTAVDDHALRNWVWRHGPALLWRDDAVEFYPGFVRPVSAVASNDSIDRVNE